MQSGSHKSSTKSQRSTALTLVLAMLFSLMGVAGTATAAEPIGTIIGEVVSVDVSLGEYRVEAQDTSPGGENTVEVGLNGGGFQFDSLPAGTYSLNLKVRTGEFSYSTIASYTAVLTPGHVIYTVFFPDEESSGIVKGQVALHAAPSELRITLADQYGSPQFLHTIATERGLNEYAFVGVKEANYLLTMNYANMQQQRYGTIVDESSVTVRDFIISNQPVTEAGLTNLSGTIASTIDGSYLNSVYIRLSTETGTWTWSAAIDPQTGHYYAYGLPAGEYAFTVYSDNPSLSYTINNVMLTQGEQAFDYTFAGASQENEGTLTGEALYMNGAPAAGSQISLKSLNADFSLKHTGGESLNGLTDSEGQFAFYGLTPGKYELQVATSSGFGASNVEVTNELIIQDILVSESSYQINGTVKNNAGQNYASAPIRLYRLVDNEWLLHTQGMSNNSGLYYINYLPPGSYKIVVNIENEDKTKLFTVTDSSVTVDIKNEPPTASFSISSDSDSYTVGSTLTVEQINYFDEEGDLSGEPLYQWIYSYTADGTYYYIEGAINKTYVIQPGDAGRYISLIFTPRALTGTLIGESVSNYGQLVEDHSSFEVFIEGELIAGVPSGLIILQATDFSGETISGLQTLKIWGDGINPVEASVEFDDTGFAMLSEFEFLEAGNHTLRFLIVDRTTERVQQFTVGANQPPAGSVHIEGEAIPGGVLVGRFEYSDPEGDPEGESIYQWMIADQQDEDFTPILGANDSEFQLRPGDAGKYIKLIVTPIAASGNSVGIPIHSEAVAIAASGEQIVSAVKFIDTDPVLGSIRGVVTWQGLTDESNISGYAVYLVDEAGMKLGERLGELPAGAAYTVAVPGMSVPIGAVGVGVFVVANDSVSYTGAASELIDAGSIEQIRHALKAEVFPEDPEPNIVSVMSVFANRQDITGDGIFDQEDARLILSLLSLPSN